MLFLMRFLEHNLDLSFYVIISVFVLCFIGLCFLSRKNGFSIEAITCSWKNIILAGLSVWLVFITFDCVEISIYQATYRVPNFLYWILKIIFLFWFTALLFRNFIAAKTLNQASWAAFPHMAFYLTISLLFTNYGNIGT